MVQVENVGVDPLDDLVVTCGDSRVVVGRVSPGDSAKVWLRGHGPRMLQLTFSQRGNATRFVPDSRLRPGGHEPRTASSSCCESGPTRSSSSRTTPSPPPRWDGSPIKALERYRWSRWASSLTSRRIDVCEAKSGHGDAKCPCWSSVRSPWTRSRPRTASSRTRSAARPPSSRTRPASSRRSGWSASSARTSRPRTARCSKAARSTPRA